MKTRELGNLEVSAVGLGCMASHTAMEHVQAKKNPSS